MNQLSRLILFGILFIPFALKGTVQLNSTFLKNEVITAKFVAIQPQINANDPLWATIPPSNISLYPQGTVFLNDKNANRGQKTKEPLNLTARAIFSQTSFFLRLSWKDLTPNIMQPTDIAKFADAVALEFATQYGPEESLPYIGMGDEKHPVIVYYKRAMKSGKYEKQSIAKGFGSMTRVENPDFGMTLTYDAKNSQWLSLFHRPLKSQYNSLNQQFVPIAFSVWDGSKFDRGGNKSISSWKFLRFTKFPVDETYIKYISYGLSGEKIGDSKKGEVLAKSNCVGCHRFASFKMALDGMAPDLTAIGSIAHPTYLKESLSTPHKIVLRNLNLNRHYNPLGTKDRFGAYPNNELYTWYVDNQGKRISKMPSFSFLSPEQLNDLVVYLMTLTL